MTEKFWLGSTPLKCRHSFTSSWSLVGISCPAAAGHWLGVRTIPKLVEGLDLIYIESARAYLEETRAL